MAVWDCSSRWSSHTTVPQKAPHRHVLLSQPTAARSPLVHVLAGVSHPRHRRGVRHALPVVLTCAAAAVLVGARTWVAVAEWTHDTDRDALSQLGVEAGVRLPTELTFRRTLGGIDADELDQRLARWARPGSLRSGSAP